MRCAQLREDAARVLRRWVETQPQGTYKIPLCVHWVQLSVSLGVCITLSSSITASVGLSLSIDVALSALMVVHEMVVSTREREGRAFDPVTRMTGAVVVFALMTCLRLVMGGMQLASNWGHDKDIPAGVQVWLMILGLSGVIGLAVLGVLAAGMVWDSCLPTSQPQVSRQEVPQRMVRTIYGTTLRKPSTPTDSDVEAGGPEAVGECPICRESATADEGRTWFEPTCCRKQMHGECLRQAVRHSGTCPFCRNPFEFEHPRPQLDAASITIQV